MIELISEKNQFGIPIKKAKCNKCGSHTVLHGNLMFRCAVCSKVFPQAIGFYVVSGLHRLKFHNGTYNNDSY